MKRFIIRSFAALLALCSVLIMASCEKTPNNPSDTTTDISYSTSEVDTTEVPTATLDVVVDGKAQLEIIRSENATDAMVQSCISLNKRLTKLLGVSFKLNDDWVKRGTTPVENAPEILVGETNRQASIDFIASLPAGSYGIRVTEHQVIIAGTNDSMTAYALYDFENNYLRNKEYKTENGFALPVGDKIVTDEAKSTYVGIMNSIRTVVAYISNPRSQSPVEKFNATQGAATDGTYFYIALKNKTGDLETDVIVKRKMDDWSLVATSEVLPLDHANDMCYNTKENVLVVTNMKGQTISIIDPETLTVIRQVDATALGGVPYAIAYNAKRDRYCIAAGGMINICDADFKVESTIAMHREAGYIGQGMDCDDNFIYMPLSCDSSQGTNDNIIVVYTWSGYKRTVHLDTKMESETLINWDGKYYINFNNSGCKIYDIEYDIVFR